MKLKILNHRQKWFFCYRRKPKQYKKNDCISLSSAFEVLSWKWLKHLDEARRWSRPSDCGSGGWYRRDSCATVSTNKPCFGQESFKSTFGSLIIARIVIYLMTSHPVWSMFLAGQSYWLVLFSFMSRFMAMATVQYPALLQVCDMHDCVCLWWRGWRVRGEISSPHMAVIENCPVVPVQR